MRLPENGPNQILSTVQKKQPKKQKLRFYGNMPVAGVANVIYSKMLW